MAQVVQQYTKHQFSRSVIGTVCSTRGRRDWAAPLLWGLAFLRLTKVRIGNRTVVAVFHISQGGSMVREGSLAWYARVFLRVKVIMHVHGSHFARFGVDHPKLAGFALRSADRVLTLTSATTEVVQQITRCETPVLQIANAVSAPVTVVQKERIVLFAGEVGYRKGIDTLMSAWSGLGDSTQGWTLVIAGPVRAEVENLLVGENVRVQGALGGAAVERLEAAAAIAVLPSRDEALPMFLIESLAHSCAVIATNVGQIAELIDGAGILIEPDDPNSLARAIDLLIHSEERREQCGKAGQKRFESRYAIEAVADQLEQAWLSVLTDLPHVEAGISGRHR